MTHTCLHCHNEFTGAHNAKYCQSIDCQRARRRIQHERWAAANRELDLVLHREYNRRWRIRAALDRLMNAYQETTNA